jgi:pimeloyl-ACP methyl ester carboxylesterase
MKTLLTAIFKILFASVCIAQSTNSTIILHDLEWDKTSPASQIGFTIPSNNFLLQGFMYKANGSEKHPTLLLLHGYPGNERNLDLAQVVRSHGWNVIYFNYRGSWGSQGEFSFKNCVEDVVNVVGFCLKYRDSLQIDTSNIVLFGHSLGAWVCFKALQELPNVKKGFALSTWDIYGAYKNETSEKEIIAKVKADGDECFVLNTPIEKIFKPVIESPDYFNLTKDAKALAGKQIVMLDEHTLNKKIADAIRIENKSFFEYQVLKTDHPFTNKRVSLMNKVIEFLDR